MTDDIELISSYVDLPNGVRVPNRLAKAAMEEGIGTGGGLPGKHHQRLYSSWAQGGWGMIITGRPRPCCTTFHQLKLQVMLKWTSDI
jgi:2,4-dienoyl-CoA reductase-like NADH-dependent reductase (Old Yellow Enzyme family)